MNLILNLAKSAFVFVALSLLIACDPSQQPLIFASSNILGVDLSVSPANTAPVTASVGYKSFDFAVVPVTSVDRAGISNAIRGCQIIGSAPSCPSELGPPPPQSGRSVVDLSPKEAPPSTDDVISASGERISPAEIRPVMFPIAPAIRGAATAQAQPLAASKPLSNPAPSPPSTGDGTRAQVTPANMRDALSVYSSFNTDAFGGFSKPVTTSSSTNTSSPGQVSINLGKVFATGVAAQMISQGQDFFLQQSGSAQCVAELAKAVGGPVAQETVVQVCGTKIQ